MKTKQKKSNWLRQGLMLGIAMFCLNLIMDVYIAHREITFKYILVSLPIWLIGGLIWGYFRQRVINRKNK